MSTPDLPVGYYLDNFLTILDFVDLEYEDLLNSDEKQFSRAFRSFTTDAQRLYVRFISRKGPRFRGDKLRYPEIGHIPGAAEELAKQEFIQIDGVVPAEELLALLTKPEIVEFVASERESDAASIRSLKREELVDFVLECVPEDDLRRYIHPRFRIYSPLKTQDVLIYRLLFFGNLHQDLTEFVLIDLGLYRYEKYQIDRSDRLFNSRQILDTTFSFIAMREEYHKAKEEKDTQGLVDIAERLPDAQNEPTLLRLHDRTMCGIARELERNAMLHEALGLYERATRPPSRERRARILERLHQFDAAHDLCREILEKPYDEEELEFANRFAPKLAKKLGYEMSPPGKISIPTDELVLSFSDDLPVEMAVLQYYEEQGVRGIYTENHLWKTLFGLAFWDIIFMPVRGVFFNRYQRGPVDLFSSAFRHQRAEAIGNRLEEILRSQSWPEEMLERYDEKQGTANYLVNWDALERQDLELSLQRVNRNHMVRIFDRFSRDVRGNKTGFPDLILFPDTALGYELIEVKGPGDTLQSNQKRWMGYFAEWGIPFTVVTVEWV